MIVVYIAGPYTTDTKEQTALNIKIAREMSEEVWAAGFAAICPHLNTANFDTSTKIPYRRFLRGYVEILTKCDCVLVLPGWLESEGTNIEIKIARENNIPIIHSVNSLTTIFGVQQFTSNQDRV